jgi:hypothetical protein
MLKQDDAVNRTTQEALVTLTGGCYCGQITYELTQKAIFKALCYCRACQHVSGGGPNFFMLVPKDGFAVTKGALATFQRPDLDHAVTRGFCRDCGTHINTRRPGLDGVVVKVGTLDRPAEFGAPRAAIYVAEKQPFHVIPDDLPQYEGLPGG